MKLAIMESPGEYLFALLMAVSPCIGCWWVTPDLTKWLVFATGAAMTVITFFVAMRPIKVAKPAR